MGSKQPNILFISPTPTHPANAGNRMHILSLASFLKAQGFVVYFLYLPFESFDERAMKEYWGEKLILADPGMLFRSPKNIPYYARKIFFKSCRALRLLQKITGGISREQYLYNSEADIHFPDAAIPVIRKLQREIKFDAVICEYAAQSKALTLFDSSVYKILDTHDRFTDRFRVYLDQGLEPSWVSLYRDQEKKAIARADLVIALQDQELTFFKELGARNLVRYSAVPETRELGPRAFEKKLLYFASANDNNRETIRYFLDKIFPGVLQQHPDTRLIVGGGLSKTLENMPPEVVLAGTFEKARDFYSMGDIVINPEEKGTGFKIKTLEALAFGKPVVASPVGAAGMTEPDMEHIQVAGDPSTFSQAIIRVIEDPDLRNRLSIHARQWIDRYDRTVRTNLLKVLPFRSVRIPEEPESAMIP